jgi:hypothetical protein
MTQFVTKDSGQRTSFDTGARRDLPAGKGRFDLLPPLALKRLSQLYERGSVKYSARNWEHGIPVSRMFDSALRHLLQALAGEQDEDHLIGAVWNLLGIVEFEERVKLGVLPATLFAEMGPLYDWNRRKASGVEQPPSKKPLRKRPRKP